jgi:GMP synthase (glutamine-hydrolysing)
MTFLYLDCQGGELIVGRTHAAGSVSLDATDGMTAESHPFDHDFLAGVATRLINEVRGINRVVYDVTS